MFKKFKDFFLLLDYDGLYQVYKLNNGYLEDFLLVEVLKQSSFNFQIFQRKPAPLLFINEKKIFILFMDQYEHNLLVQKLYRENSRRQIQYQSKYLINKPFYFPSDIKQFECVGGKFIWLNETKLQILNEKSGKVINSVNVNANKFILDSKSNIHLINKTAKKLQVYEKDGSFLEEYTIDDNLLEQPFFLDREDKFIFLNTKTFDLHLQ